MSQATFKTWKKIRFQLDALDAPLRNGIGGTRLHARRGTLCTPSSAHWQPLLDTTNLQNWIKGNIISLLLLVIAVMLFVVAQRGDNAKAMRVSGGRRRRG